MNILEHLAKAIAERGLSVVIATATLMSLFHFRNAHLSERARATVSECLYSLYSSSLDQDTKSAQLDSLLWQAKRFINRYKATCRAFFLLVLTLVLLMIAIILCGTSEQAMQASGLTLAGVAFGSMLWALCIGAKEFLSGHETLEKQVSILTTRTDALRRGNAKPGLDSH